jgi:hypothetical protein
MWRYSTYCNTRNAPTPAANATNSIIASPNKSVPNETTIDEAIAAIIGYVEEDFAGVFGSFRTTFSCHSRQITRHMPTPNSTLAISPKSIVCSGSGVLKAITSPPMIITLPRI